MGKIMELARNGLCALLMAAAPASVALAKTTSPDPNGYAVPDIASAKFLGEKQKNIDGIECSVKGYKSKDGERFNTVAVRSTGRVFGYAIFDPNQTLMDTDCDGDFDTRYSQEETWQIPKCAQK